MEGELIFLGFIMLIGQMILLQMWQNNWFKKENFKIKRASIMGENRLKLKKLERDLGLPISKELPKEAPGTIDTLSNLTGLLPLLKNLDPDQLSMLIDRFLGGDAPGAQDGDPINMLMDYATRNPEMVQGLIEGLTRGKQGQDTFISE